MISSTFLAAALSLPALASAIGLPGLVVETPHFGPEVTVEHLYMSEFPTGITVSSKGRLFSNFPRASNYTVAELVNGKEIPFPSLAYNTPPAYINASVPNTATNYQNYLISVQSVIIDAKDRLWALDTGRPTINGFQYLNGGGAKLVGFDLNSNSKKPFKTIVLPLTVAYPETVLNDVRFDLRPSITKSGQGVAYITDSSVDARNGIIVVDLGTGESWRHLEMHPSTLPDEGLIASYNGEAFLPVYPSTGIADQWRIGADGIALSPDGAWLYYTSLAARTWWKVPTSELLRNPNPKAGGDALAAWSARRSVVYLGRLPSHVDGFESDADGNVFISAPELSSIYIWNPKDEMLKLYVRDKLIQWPDTLAVSNKKKLYFTVNQAWLAPNYNNGTDKRTKPYALLSVPITADRIELK